MGKLLAEDEVGQDQDEEGLGQDEERRDGRTQAADGDVIEAVTQGDGGQSGKDDIEPATRSHAQAGRRIAHDKGQAPHDHSGIDTHRGEALAGIDRAERRPYRDGIDRPEQGAAKGDDISEPGATHMLFVVTQGHSRHSGRGENQAQPEARTLEHVTFVWEEPGGKGHDPEHVGLGDQGEQAGISVVETQGPEALHEDIGDRGPQGLAPESGAEFLLIALIGQPGQQGQAADRVAEGVLGPAVQGAGEQFDEDRTG